MTLPNIPSVETIQERLQTIFPNEFRDRSILVGIMAARVVFVSLYGGFIAGNARYFRPSTITNFSDEQAKLSSRDERHKWLERCHRPKFKPLGDPWYAPNSREPIRDDLIRNRMIPLGIMTKLEGYAPTHPTPIYSISPSFAALFDPDLDEEKLESALTKWREDNLNPMALRRMALLASGVKAKEGHVNVTLPTSGKTLRLAPGEASIITRDVCEVLAPAMCAEAVVVHVSLSDQKLFPELAGEAKAVGLSFDVGAALPDVAFVDVARDPMPLIFVEVVHSDGPITELRAKALLNIAERAGIPAEHVVLVTAFEDRSSEGFRKRFSELAFGSNVWFRSEPEMLLALAPLS